MLSFFSSRRNWDSPNPLPAGECGPPPASGEGLGAWESPNSDEGTDTVLLCIYKYFVDHTADIANADSDLGIIRNYKDDADAVNITLAFKSVNV